MAQRQQQPLTSSVLIIGLSMILIVIHFASDLNSPTLFIIKAGIQIISLGALLSFLVFAIWKRKKLVVASVVFAWLINIPFLLPNTQLTRQANIASNGASLSAATFSTLTRTKNVDDIVSFAKLERPDVLCLQEVSAPDRALLLETLKELYPNSVQNNNNQITLSRYPLKEVDNHGDYQATLLVHPIWGQLSIINVHMPRPYRSKGVSNTWRKLLTLVDSDSPLLLCGDLNTTPNNSLYELLRYDYGLEDAHKSGYGFTFPNAQRKSALFGPLIRIDYLLTKGLSAKNTRTINASNLSDHKAVISNFVLKKNNLK